MRRDVADLERVDAAFLLRLRGGGKPDEDPAQTERNIRWSHVRLQREVRFFYEEVALHVPGGGEQPTGIPAELVAVFEDGADLNAGQREGAHLYLERLRFHDDLVVDLAVEVRDGAVRLDDAGVQVLDAGEVLYVRKLNGRALLA